MIKEIKSISNPYIKEIAKLKDIKYRNTTRRFLIEGYHLIEEAYKAGILEEVLITNVNDLVNGVTNILTTPLVINKLAHTKTPQPIIGICCFLEEQTINGKRFLLLDNIQDPGNVGTLIRTALGFDIDMIILSDDSTDIYNDKLIRASQGTLLHIPIKKMNLLDAISILKNIHVPVFGTSLKGQDSDKIASTDTYALILGNEGQGIHKEILDVADSNLYISISEKLESLNVAVAGAILMYSFRKRW